MVLPPGPPGPALLHMALLFREPVGFLERCARRYGEIFKLRYVGFGTLFYVADPDAVKEIFTGDPNVFRAGEANAIMEPMLGPSSVLLLDGDRHMGQRRLLLPPFHGESVGRYGDLMQEIAAQEVERWPLGEPFALRPRMQAITLEIILRAVFGIEEASRLARLRSLLPRLIAGASNILWLPLLRRNLGPLSPWARFVKLRDAVDEIVYEEIRRRRALGDDGLGGDVLSLLLRARHTDGEPMSDGELRDELMTLVLAGHETTATGMSWALERLLRHPAALERLVSELEEGEDAYLDAVIKETLRLRPPVFDVARLLSAPVELNGYSLPAGSYVVPAITLIQRLPRLYPDADAFRPERFLDDQPDPYTWIPFGGGVRRCVGAAFATFEMKVVLRTVLGTARLEAPEQADEKARLQNVTLVPARGARVVLRERVALNRDAADEREPARA